MLHSVSRTSGSDKQESNKQLPTVTFHDNASTPTSRSVVRPRGCCGFGQKLFGGLFPKDEFTFTIRVHQCILRLPQPSRATVLFRQGCVRVDSLETFQVPEKPSCGSLSVKPLLLQPTVLLKRATSQGKDIKSSDVRRYAPSIARLQVVVSPHSEDGAPQAKKHSRKLLGEASLDLSIYTSALTDSERRYVQLPLNKCLDPHASLVISIATQRPGSQGSSENANVTLPVKKPATDSPAATFNIQSLNSQERSPQTHTPDDIKQCTQHPKIEVEHVKTFSFGLRPEESQTSPRSESPSVASATRLPHSAEATSTSPFLAETSAATSYSVTTDDDTARRTQPSPSYVSDSKSKTSPEIFLNPDATVLRLESNASSTDTAAELRASLAQMEEALQRKTTTIVELQTEMHETVKALEGQLEKERKRIVLLEQTSANIHTEKNKRIAVLSTQLEQAQLALRYAQQALEATRHSSQASAVSSTESLVSQLRSKNAMLESKIQNLETQLRHRCAALNTLELDYKERTTQLQRQLNLIEEHYKNSLSCEMNKIASASEHTLQKETVPILNRTTIMAQTILLPNRHDLDSTDRSHHLETALEQAHKELAELHAQLHNLKARQTFNPETKNQQRIFELEQELISTKLKLAESETEKGATAATSKNTIEKLQGTISDYISLSTDLQVQVSDLRLQLAEALKLNSKKTNFSAKRFVGSLSRFP